MVLMPVLETLAAGTTHTVCAQAERTAACQFAGPSAIQKAIDAAASGDTIVVKAGRYGATEFRDIPYKEIKVRGFVVVDAKDLSIKGEAGVVLDGATGPATSAIVIRNARVVLQDLELANFRYQVEEDDTYDGHGVFVIDGTLRADNVVIRNFKKMGLTGRGDSLLDVSNLKLLDGHVAVWLHETAYLRLRHALVKNNDGSGIAAYDHSAAHVIDSVFDTNQDDGLYTEHQATLFVEDSLVLNNRPIGLNALNDSRIYVSGGALHGNASDTKTKDAAAVVIDPNVHRGDPRVDGAYQPLPGSPMRKAAPAK